jgi:hypothetical protein
LAEPSARLALVTGASAAPQGKKAHKAGESLA